MIPRARQPATRRPPTATQRCSAFIVLLALISIARSAHGHQASVVYLDVAVQDRTIDVEARLAAADLMDPMGLSPLDAITPAVASARASTAASYVRDYIVIHNGAATCTGVVGRTEIRPRDDSFTLAVAIRYTCGRQVDDLRIRYLLLLDLDPRSEGIAEIHAFGSTSEHVFRSSERELRVTGDPSRLAQAADYLVLGVEHIFTGYDHIAFLISLLIVAASRGARSGVRYAIGLVTAFTVAHSITLACAALSLVQLPARWVESAIAASILYVALENVLNREPRFRWMLTFVFGLVHGFGFASVLRELGLPRRGLALSLVGFNFGVEFGQMLVVCAAFPILLLARRASWRWRECVAMGVLVAVACGVLAQFGVPAVTLAAVACGGSVALAAAATRWGYPTGVRVGASLVIAALATLWLAERVSGQLVVNGVLG